MSNVPVDPTVPLDLAAFEPEFNRDPYPLYAELRTVSPVRSAVVYGVPVWLITRYAEAREALADPRFKHDRVHATEQTREAGPWMFLTEKLGFDRYMLASDPPDHTRLRRVVNKVFTPRRVEALRPWIQELTAETFDRFLPAGRVDVIEEVAYPVPIMVISQLLGLPDADRDDVRRWAESFSSAGALDPSRMLSGFLSMREYFENLIARRTAQIEAGAGVGADADMLTAMIAVRDEGERLDANELLAMAFQILVGGFETTANMIGTGVLALLQHPDQQAVLRAEPGLVPNAIEEMMRYDAPVKQPWFRFTTEDVPVGDVVVPAGSVVVVNLASANRDPQRYPDPDRFDVRRDASGQLCFSHGPHFCMGAPLARLEGEIIFSHLLRHCEDLRLAVDPAELSYRASPSMRILERLPVTFTPVPAAALAVR